MAGSTPVATPVTAAPSGSAATRLFASGFEAPVTIGTAAGYGNADQYLSGGDVAAHRWPLDLWSTPSQWSAWILSVVGTNTPQPVTAYVSNTIKTVTGRDGRPTRALSLHSIAQSPRTSVQQIAMQNAGMAIEPVLYQRMWIKFATDTLARARAVGSRDFYQIFWEMKAEPDYRIRMQLQYGAGGNLYWQVQGDRLVNAVPLWESTLTSAPVVLAAHDSADGWHLVEVWMDRANGRFKAAIDGRTLVDRHGELTGASGNVTDQLKMMMVYSTVAPLTEVLFDDFEVWDRPPLDAWVGD